MSAYDICYWPLFILFWCPLAISAHVYTSATNPAKEQCNHHHSEGCWLFVMRGNMTCPQTMGCCFLHEANAAFDRQLPFFRFAKFFDFQEDHFTHTAPLYPDKEISSLMFSWNCLFSFTSPSVPQNKWWHADLTFLIFCGMVGWHNTAEEFGDFHKSKQTSGPSLNN